MLRLNLKWKGRDVKVFNDAEDIVVNVDGRDIYDHEFDLIRNEEYFELFKIVEDEFGERLYSNHSVCGNELMIAVLPKHNWGYVYNDDTFETETFDYYVLESGTVGFTKDDFNDLSYETLSLIVKDLVG